MIMLKTYERHLGEGSMRHESKLVSVQYFPDDELSKAHALAKTANTHFELNNDSSLGYVCIPTYIDDETGELRETPRLVAPIINR